MTYPVQGEKFVSGRLMNGRLFLTRSGGSEVRCGAIIVQAATLTDNGDSTVDIELGT